jgi:hypothetical protein
MGVLAGAELLSKWPKRGRTLVCPPWIEFGGLGCSLYPRFPSYIVNLHQYNSLYETIKGPEAVAHFLAWNMLARDGVPREIRYS